MDRSDLPVAPDIFLKMQWQDLLEEANAIQHVSALSQSALSVIEDGHDLHGMEAFSL